MDASRRFDRLDAIILLLAAILAGALLCVSDRTRYGFVPSGWDEDRETPRTWVETLHRSVGRLDADLGLILVAATLGLATSALRRRPLLIDRRGPAAGLAAMLVGGASAILWMAWSAYYHFMIRGFRVEKFRLPDFLASDVVPLAATATGQAVLGAWVVLLMLRRRRDHPFALDRAGRVVGAAWALKSSLYVVRVLTRTD